MDDTTTIVDVLEQIAIVEQPKPKRVRKPAAKKKKVVKTKAKPKAKKKTLGKRLIKAAKKRGRKVASPAAVRSERADLRLTKAEKAKLVAKAKKTRRTVTSVMLELIEKMR